MDLNETLSRALKLKQRAEDMLEYGASDEVVNELYREARLLSIVGTGMKAASKATSGRWTREDRAALREALGEPDADSNPVRESARFSSGLYDAVMRQGFDRRTKSAVEVPFELVKFKAATFDGTFEDSNRRIVTSPPLGYDSRFLWPSLPTTAVDSGVTGIQSFRQKERTLASSSDIIRDIDDTSAKPETATVTEIVTADMHQIANMQSGVPNVILDNAQFRQFIESDLRLGYNEGTDYMVLTEIANSTPTTATGGSNPVEDVLYAMEALAAAGYTADVLVFSPEDALAYQLAQLTGGDAYIKAPNVSLRLVVSKNLSGGDGLVLDTSSAGQLYLSPARLAVFEEEAGSTNTSTVRFESHGTYIVQREDAIAGVGSVS